MEDNRAQACATLILRHVRQAQHHRIDSLTRNRFLQILCNSSAEQARAIASLSLWGSEARAVSVLILL